MGDIEKIVSEKGSRNHRNQSIPRPFSQRGPIGKSFRSQTPTHISIPAALGCVSIGSFFMYQISCCIKRQLSQSIGMAIDISIMGLEFRIPEVPLQKQVVDRHAGLMAAEKKLVLPAYQKGLVLPRGDC